VQNEEEQKTSEILQATTRRIKELGQQGKTKDAIQCLADLAKQNVEPDTLAATTLVRACCKDMSVAQSVFDELFGKWMRRLNIPMHADSALNQEGLPSLPYPPSSIPDSIASSFFLLGGGFLEPDEVTFAVLLRGYGAQTPPAWPSIDTCLTQMKNKHSIQPTASE
jgi:hypothetical protein